VVVLVFMVRVPVVVAEAVVILVVVSGVVFIVESV